MDYTFNKKRCCFAGHSRIEEPELVKENLINAVENLIANENVLDFQVGKYGCFDDLALSVLIELKHKYENINIDVVIPYLTKSLFYEFQKQIEDYQVVVAQIPQNTPRKFQIIKCNEYMINSSDYLITYIRYTWGGAYMTKVYGEKKKIKIIEI